ncbi:hypothetical protein B0T13DRAFT_498571 [Neurospora crassa]|nr:hypothetical protein B0T13DRAFT_498571 [Neurospora crassa]
MASPAPEPPSTGVVALDSARRTLSVILAGEIKLTPTSKDRATDIHYSAEALLRLTKLLPRSIRTFDKMNQASQVAKYFLLPSPKCKSNHKRRSDYIDEACALYHSIAEGLERLHINEDIYRFNLQNHGHLFMNEEIRSKRLLKVQGDVESLLEIMLEIEREDEQFSGVRQSLVAQDPDLMTVVELRKNGEFVIHALFEKGIKSWPN